MQVVSQLSKVMASNREELGLATRSFSCVRAFRHWVVLDANFRSDTNTGISLSKEINDKFDRGISLMGSLLPFPCDIGCSFNVR